MTILHIVGFRLPAQVVFLAKMWRFLRRWPIVPLAILTVLVVAAVFAPQIAPHSPYSQELTDRNTPPFWYATGSKNYVLGADYVGRDVLSRVIHGARVSLTVVAVSATTGLVVGTSLGLIAGYFGGLIDEVVMRLVDVWFSLPYLLLALLAALIIGRSFAVVVGLIALLAWSTFVRNIRAETMYLKAQDYVGLARVAGASHTHILLRHILPGITSTAIVIATLRVGQLVMAEATLSFLGAGIPSPTPAWGLMVAEGRDYAATAWWISFFPGFAIFLVVFTLNFLGDWMRDRLDPRLRQI